MSNTRFLLIPMTIMFNFLNNFPEEVNTNKLILVFVCFFYKECVHLDDQYFLKKSLQIHNIHIFWFPQTTARYGPVTLLRMIETYELRMKNHKIIFIRTKSPWKCRIVRILTVLNLWVAYGQRMTSVWPAYDQRMSAYVQRVTSVWPAYSAYVSVWPAYSTYE